MTSDLYDMAPFAIDVMGTRQYSDVIWAFIRLKLLATRRLVQLVVPASSKENTKVQHGSTGDRWDSPHPHMRPVIHYDFVNANVYDSHSTNR